MKQYHPAAHILEPQSMLVTGYILHNDDKNHEALMVSAERFSQLVYEEKVQLLRLASTPQYGEGMRQYDHRIVVDPTPEERRKFKRAKNQLDISFDTYLMSDATFNHNDILMANSRFGYLAVSMIQTATMLGVPLSTVEVYRGCGFDADSLHHLKTHTGTTVARLASNLVILVANPNQLVSALRSFGEGYGINTMTNDNPNNIAYQMRMPMGLKVDRGATVVASQILQTYAG